VGTPTSPIAPGPRRILAAIVIAASVLAACGQKATGDRPPQPSPSSVPALKLAVLSAVGGHLDYCDPDRFPVAHGTPLQNAENRLPTIKADRAAYQVILAHLHITDDSSLTAEQKVAINELYKQMRAIELKPSGNGYGFSDLIPASPSDAGPPTRMDGTVDRFGHVRVTARHPGQRPVCPICLAFGVTIATPAGPVAIQDIQVGMPVWTTDRTGRRVRAVVVRVGHMVAPLGHEVVRLTLADGRMVMISPGHPTADGRRVGELRPGDRLGGTIVVSVRRLPYANSMTYDLLPSGPTGTYYANGIAFRSTLLFSTGGFGQPGVTVSTARQQYQAAMVR
jgi:hypothetical protein